MDYTSAPGYVTDAQGRRQYQDRDLLNGVKGTSLVAKDRNAVLNALMYLIQAVQIVPNPDDDSQVWAAVEAMIRAALVGTGGTLDFMPVQQGGGPNQTTDKINLGQDSTYEGLLRLSIDGADHGTLLSGTYLATITGTTGDLPGMGLWFQAASKRPAFTYQDATGLPKIIDLAMNSDVQTLQSNLSAFQTTQTNTNATLSADISQCVSGVYGVATSAGDRQGKGLYQAGGSARPTFVYNNGTTDVYNALAYYADVTALSATLSTDISNCVSGIAASGDAQGLKLYQSTGSGRPHFFYTGGDEYLATYTDVTTVQANLTSFQTSQANQNSTFATEIASKVGTNTTNDGVNSPITYLGHNNASGAPFVISPLAGSYRIIPSRPGAGFNSISNMSTDGSGNIILKDSSTADAYV
ncbi:hypothetical protein, partial [Komagataeibacter oboediens]